MNKETIKELALTNGFKLKEQPDGAMDLNPYVYEFAAALERVATAELKAQVEQLREFAELIVEWKEYGFQRAKILLDSTPAQCLAEIKAQALEDEAQLWPDDLTECSHVKSTLIKSANQLRQQAKGE